MSLSWPGALLVAVAALSGSAIARYGGVIALVAPATASLLALTLSVHRLTRGSEGPDQDRVLWWTLVSLGVHVAVGLTISASDALTTYLGGDASTYHDQAKALVGHWTTGAAVPDLPGGREGFYYLVAGLYWVFGPHIWSGLVVNAALAAALVPVLSDTTRRLFGAEAARYIPPLAVLIPGLLLWTSQLLKEAPILFLIAVAVNLAVRLLERSSLGLLVALAGAAGLLFTLRGYVALVLVGSLLFAISVGKHQLVSGIAVGSGTAVLIGVLMLTSGIGYTGYRSGVTSNLQQANVVRSELARSATSGFGSEVDISTPQRAISYLPVGLVNFGLGPAPWQLTNLRHLPALADAMVWWALLPALWRGHRASRRVTGRRRLVLEIPALAVAALLALVIGNFGTVLRERLQVIILVLPLIALGLPQRASAPVSPRVGEEVGSRG